MGEAEVWSTAHIEYSARAVTQPSQLGILACAAVLFYTYTYADIQRQDIQRRAYIRNEVAQGATTVVVHHLKDEQFTHDITLDGDREWNDYKDFYGIDPDIKILVEPEN